jgi:acetyl-CoA decarbonylase/synthase complex subunit gamma
VPQVASELTLADRLGAWKVRWGIGRMSFMVPPGLYAVGMPTPADPVVVTANYKMSYDIIRRTLAGRNCWLLVLETYGINVWCAAGKGTFGTGELVRRIASSGLAEVVTHRRVILPILGAPGVSAHEVARRSGFSVSYAAIRASDLPQYLDNGMVTTQAMREQTFSFYERLVLVPVELVMALKSTAVIMVCLYVLGFFMAGSPAGIKAAVAYLGAVVAGVVLGPLLLPWLPGRAFSVKGAVAGLAWSGAWYLLAEGDAWGLPAAMAAFVALPAVSAFYTLNFTGCTPFTSRSGVKKEMRIALPIMGGALVVSAIILLVGKLFLTQNILKLGWIG